MKKSPKEMQAFTSSFFQQNQNQMELALEEEDELELSALAELETLSTTNLLSYIIHDSHLYPSLSPQITILPLHNNNNNNNENNNEPTVEKRRSIRARAGMKRKRKGRAKVCKSKEEAETQRMTHIAVERNRRKLMNEHLTVLRSLMPEHYAQRGDQASIVGGAIECVKELEHLLQTLEAQKLLIHTAAATSSSSGDPPPQLPRPFSQFFSFPQYTWTTYNNNIHMDNAVLKSPVLRCLKESDKNIMVSHNNYDCTAMSSSSNDVADIEVSMIETHANVRILSRRSFSQLSKVVSAFYSHSLSILHLNVTTLDPFVLYSISAKVEEGCQLTSAVDIADAVHNMLRMIQEEAALC